MSIMDEAPAWYPRYKLIQWSAALVLMLLLLYGFFGGKFESLHVRLAFCAFGVATGAAFARMSHPSDRELTRLGQISLGFVAAAQVFYQMLVWSEAWRVHPSVLGWRLWWASVVIAVGLGWLQVLWRAGARWKWNSGRTTLGFTSALGLLFVAQTFISKPLTFPKWWIWTAGVLALGMGGGSLVIIGRWLRNRPKSTRPLPPWMKPALYTLGTVSLCAGSFYIGRVTLPPPSLFDLMPSALVAMPEDQLKQQLDVDFRTIRVLVKGMDELHDQTEKLHVNIASDMEKDGRTIYTPTENRKIRRLFIEYLIHRDSLIRMAALYAGYTKVQDEKLRHRAYLLGYTAAAVALEAGRSFVDRYRDNKTARDKLNEGERGLKADMFEEVYHSVTSRTHLELFEEHGKLFEEQHEKWRSENFLAENFEWMAKRIHRGKVSVGFYDLDPTRAWFSRIGRRLQKHAYRPVYEAQELVATFVGDTRIVRRAPFIPAGMVREALERHKFMPGDIIVERRNWYLSNAFLPGFWPHCALYVGTTNQLKATLEKALPELIETLPRWQKEGFFVNLKSDGLMLEEMREAYMDELGEARKAHAQLDHSQPRVILEAVSEGVVFSTAEHSLTADYVAVLRPDLSAAERSMAILRACKHYGKPYDFNFDFGTADKLVCSELLYHAYEGLLDFQMETVLGKKVITPLGIMNKFASEHRTPKAELAFVLFLDTPPGDKYARFADAKACCESVTRPKAFNE